MSNHQPTYYVVLEDQFGVRTIVNFETQKHFQKVRRSNVGKVIAEGVSFEAAQELTTQVTGKAYFHAALAQWLVEGAEPERLVFNLRNAAFAAESIGQGESFREAMLTLGLDLSIMASS